MYRIANQYGVTVAQIKQWNNLTSDVIYVGQKLAVKGGNTNNNNNNTKPTTPNTGQMKKHTVKSGDTLYGIATQYGVTVAQIKQWNNLKNDVIYVGQTLSIGGSSNSNGGSNQSQGNQSGVGTTRTHTVRSGDTLYGIGLRYGVSINEIKQKNGLKSDFIYIGQTLVISGTSTNQGGNSGGQTTGTSSTYKVKTGDSLYQIALKHGVSVSELKQTNGLKSDMIYVGQTLKIPGQTVATNTTSPSGVKRHQVKTGDSLWGLSTKYGTSVSKIKQWNGLTSDVIYKGQNLRVG